MNKFSIITRPLFRSSRHIGVSVPIQRFFSTTSPRLSNLLGEVTKIDSEPPITTTSKSTTTSSSSEDNKDISKITPENDEELIEYHAKNAESKQFKIEKYIHPLKLQLYNENVSQFGFFKNGQIMNHNGKKLRFTLTPQEIDILEPSIYLTSYRIKSSMKKATIVNRMVRKFNVKLAINQLHFNHKKISTELEQLLKRGLEQAKQLELNEDELYIDRIWVGSDGKWRKRLDPKGRGRMGIIAHRYIHLKCILKTNQTKLRLDWEKQQKELKSKPRMFLNDEPLNLKVRPWYRW
ncbi:hypothetical protein L150_03533 [Candida albicans Ca529L]|nr:hypothetical protein L150_03533 [Candida albicans Ca529L]